LPINLRNAKLIEQNLAILDKCKKKKTRKVSHIVGDLRELYKKRKEKGYSLYLLTTIIFELKIYLLNSWFINVSIGSERPSIRR
jgi:hypothetical protein